MAQHLEAPSHQHHRPRLLSVFSAEAYSLLAIIAVLWVGNFLHFSEFGFYEDDWYYFPGALGVPLAATLRTYGAGILQFGRPLQGLGLDLAICAGVISGSVPAFYFVTFLLSAAKSVLAYFVLRLRFGRTLATASTVLFVISPLTTIRQSLGNESFVAPAFCFAFAAILLYARRRFTLAYLMAAFALLTYEPMFFLVMAAPLFSKYDTRRQRAVELARHVVVCAVIFAAVFWGRRYGGEARVASVAGGPGVIWRMIRFDLFYSANWVRAYIYATHTTLKNLSLESAFYSLVFLLGASVCFLRGGAAKILDRDSSPERRESGVGMGLGAILIVLAFSLAAFHLGYGLQWQFAGRDTRIASAAAFGSSLLVASLFLFLTEVVSARFMKRAITATFIVLLAVLFGYSILIQQDYVAVWRHDVSLLNQAIMLTPDAGPDTTLLIRSESRAQAMLPGQNRMPSVGLQMHGLLESFSVLSHGLIPVPKINFVETDNWAQMLAFGADGMLHWRENVLANHWKDPVVAGRIILLIERPDGFLVRSDREIMADGKAVQQGRDSGVQDSHWKRFLQDPLSEQILGRLPWYVTTANTQSAKDSVNPPIEQLLDDPHFPKGTLILEAERFSRGNAVADWGPFGLGIGVVDTPTVVPAFVEYDLTPPSEGDYDLYIRYASALPRPMTVTLNDRVITVNACSQATGGWHPPWQFWQKAGSFHLAAGSSRLRLSRDSVFPHIDKIALRPSR